MANKSVDLKKESSRITKANTSDYTIAYEDFNDYFYGKQGSYDDTYSTTNLGTGKLVPAKVVISNSKNVPYVANNAIKGGYRPNTGTKVLKLPGKIGNPFSSTTKSAWMNSKLPAGVQSSFKNYFKNSTLSTDEPSTSKNAYNELVKKGFN